MQNKMERRLQLCRKTAYVGIALVLLVYIALSYISGNLAVLDAIPGWLVAALQFLLGIGSALTIAGILLGMYYKGRSSGKGRGLGK